MDWGALSALAAVMLGAIGYLSRQLARTEERLAIRIDGAEQRLDARIDRLDTRFDRLEEQYIRHLEAHAAHH